MRQGHTDRLQRNGWSGIALAAFCAAVFLLIAGCAAYAVSNLVA
jgi:hypothetical protein